MYQRYGYHTIIIVRKTYIADDYGRTYIVHVRASEKVGAFNMRTRARYYDTREQNIYEVYDTSKRE